MNAAAETTKGQSEDIRPLSAGQFIAAPTPGERARLRGARCRACGETFFPPRRYCAACTSGEMEDIELPSSGSVESFTIVHQQLPGSAMIPPYAIVNVRLGAGPVVQTVLREGHEMLELDDDVALVVETVLNEDSHSYVAFIARRLAGGSKEEGK